MIRWELRSDTDIGQYLQFYLNGIREGMNRRKRMKLMKLRGIKYISVSMRRRRRRRMKRMNPDTYLKDVHEHVNESPYVRSRMNVMSRMNRSW